MKKFRVLLVLLLIVSTLVVGCNKHYPGDDMLPYIVCVDNKTFVISSTIYDKNISKECILGEISDDSFSLNQIPTSNFSTNTKIYLGNKTALIDGNYYMNHENKWYQLTETSSKK